MLLMLLLMLLRRGRGGESMKHPSIQVAVPLDHALVVAPR
jgi:hypothetical protein